MKQTNFKKGLAGLVLGTGLLAGSANTSDAGLLRINNNFSSVDNPEVFCYHSVNSSVTEGFDSGQDLERNSYTGERANMYSVLGDLKLGQDKRPNGSTSDYVIELTGENLQNPVSGNITFSIPTAFTDGYTPYADFYDSDGNKILSNIDVSAYAQNATPIEISNLTNDQVYTLVIKAVPEPATLGLLGLGAVVFGALQLGRKKE